MIDAQKRRAIYLLHQEGMAYREIARRLHVSRHAVKTIIEQQGETPKVHRPKRTLDEELLRQLYQNCKGYAQRVYEKLKDEHGIVISYPTLTRRLRELGLQRGSPKSRCERVPDQPGMEMQHDTSVYKILIGGVMRTVVASMLYLRYSKKRYLKFYYTFNRFNMKCFIHEALTYWGFSAEKCIVDNTSLARLRGSGARALIVQEMISFMEQYVSRFECHEIGHSNRKAGNERSFYTVETNFLPGRIFVDLEDLNLQAFDWSTVIMEQRPQTKARIVPVLAFETERPYLNKLPSHLPAPYRVHQRMVDQYGTIQFAANHYWVPGEDREPVRVLEFAGHIEIYRRQTQLIEYKLPAQGVCNQFFAPPGQPASRYKKRRAKPTRQEEERLRAMGESMVAYLDATLPPLGRRRHRFVRQLYALSRSMTDAAFVAVIERAHKYHIADMTTLANMARLLLTRQTALARPYVDLDETFDQREAYREGCLTDMPDLSLYEQLYEEEEKEKEKEKEKDEDE